MAIGVHTDCTTPALVNFGSEKLKRTYLAPAIAGDMVTSLAVSEPGGGSDVASIKTTATRLAAGHKNICIHIVTKIFVLTRKYL